MKLHKIAYVLLIIGGLNWLLFGLFQKDLFEIIGLGMGSWISRVVYILVGLSAIVKLFPKRQEKMQM